MMTFFKKKADIISYIASGAILSSTLLAITPAEGNILNSNSNSISNNNLATTATATASSVEINTPACPGTESCTPVKAIDSNYGTRWAGLKPAGPQGVEWYMLAFPTIIDIDRIVLHWEAAYATEYEMHVSDDGVAWTTAFVESNGNGAIDTIDSLGGISGKYVRFDFLKRSQQRFGHSLYEIEVYGPSVPGVTSAPSTSSSPSTSIAPSPPPGSIPPYKNPSLPTSARVDDLLGRMTLQEKIGQMTQVEQKSLDAVEHIATYRLGSLLSGGGSHPPVNTPRAWADMVDSYQFAAMDGTPLSIPLIYGVDAVHGHSNVVGATIFPHNIGLGATRNATLLEEVGKVTAKEVYATGIPWNFSPCLAVARDERWGRTYESFGEHPEIATMMTSYIDGLQGTYESGPGLGGANTVLATPKHWLGDGGTTGGDDQGFAQLPEEKLLLIHGTPYNNSTGALSRFSKSGGIGSIMPSYSSVNFTDGSGSPGELKMHGHGHLINDVLRGDMGFEGFIISDWAAVDQLPYDYSGDVEASIKAGIDMVMVPHNYQLFNTTMHNLVRDGRLSTALVDQAVRRILTAKFHLGLFEKPYADRTYIGDVGSAPHRQVAREAVAQSLVLLKNEVISSGSPILPIDASSGISKIVVAGKNADDIGNQCGGWTITWQGSSGATTDGTTILQAIIDEVPSNVVVEYAGDRAGKLVSGDLGIVVVGERPYAEGQGDDISLLLDRSDNQAIQNVCANMPCVVVLVSGRPMIINDQLAQADAFVAAWLPGTEGNGVTDVLFGRKDFVGTLPMTWPLDTSQVPINVGDANYNPLFEYGYGCTYANPCPTPTP